MSGHWPITLRHRYDGALLELRPLHPRKDRDEWVALRRANQSWTGPWDSTTPVREAAPRFKDVVRYQNSEAVAGRLLPWALRVDGALAGQMHIFSIVRGAQLGGVLGYWIAEKYAGRGFTPVAAAMAIDYAFAHEQLHRIEANIRPENANSLRVVEKLGFRDEGIRANFLHIDGAWRDHRSFALTREEVGVDGLLARISQV